MAKVSFEVSTRIKRSFQGERLRAYIFRGQIVITDMTPAERRALRLPAGQQTKIEQVFGQIHASDVGSQADLRTTILGRMRHKKERWEKRLAQIPGPLSEKGDIVLPEQGSFKDKLTTT